MKFICQLIEYQDLFIEKKGDTSRIFARSLEDEDEDEGPVPEWMRSVIVAALDSFILPIFTVYSVYTCIILCINMFDVY